MPILCRWNWLFWKAGLLSRWSQINGFPPNPSLLRFCKTNATTCMGAGSWYICRVLNSIPQQKVGLKEGVWNIWRGLCGVKYIWRGELNTISQHKIWGRLLGVPLSPSAGAPLARATWQVGLRLHRATLHQFTLNYSTLQPIASSHMTSWTLTALQFTSYIIHQTTFELQGLPLLEVMTVLHTH